MPPERVVLGQPGRSWCLGTADVAVSCWGAACGSCGGARSCWLSLCLAQAAQGAGRVVWSRVVPVGGDLQASANPTA